jgi:hypothetical protein
MTVLGERFMQDPLLDCEDDIREHLAEHITQQCPPLLGQAMEYAVFPGGARVPPLRLPSNFCTVHHWSMTICLVSTTLHSAAVSHRCTLNSERELPF